MVDTIELLEDELRRIERRVRHAERLVVLATDRYDANEQLRLAKSLRSSIVCLQSVLERIQSVVMYDVAPVRRNNSSL